MTTEDFERAALTILKGNATVVDEILFRREFERRAEPDPYKIAIPHLPVSATSQKAAEKLGLLPKLEA